jgi:LPS-assembly protein
MKWLWATIGVWCLLGAGLLLAAESPPLTLTVEPQGEGEFEFNPQTGEASAERGVIVRYGPVTLLAQKATVNQETGEVLAEGDVRIQNEAQLWTGQKVIYNFKTRQMRTGEFRAGYSPFFVEAAGFDANLTNQTFTVTNGIVTTDDYARPAYTLRARQITMVPGKRVEARGATLYLGAVPVFYLPKVVETLEYHKSYWVLTPGYRSLYGPYLLSAYHYHWNTNLDTAFNIDYRVKRGFAGGPEFTWNEEVAGQGGLRYYYAYDLEPGVNPNTLQPIPKDRSQFAFTHQVTLRTNLTARAAVRYESDPYVVRDFYESEYRENVQPNTFVNVNQDWQNWNLNLNLQPRVNDFQETIERLPDIKLTGLRQEIGRSPFYYETESSLGYYRHLFPESDPSAGLAYPLAYEAMRADTYHQIVAPINLFGWLNLAPRVGQRFTYYGEADGPGATTDEEGRAVFNTGAEMSFKASRLWRNAQSGLLDVNGLRHIIEPSLNYAYVPSPSPEPSQLPQFDSDLPSYWLLPLDYPDYNNIDSVDTQNTMRLGLRNRLQTKRDGAVDDLLRWYLVTDWRLRPQDDQKSFSLLCSFLELRPRSWFSLSSVLRYDLGYSQLRELSYLATLHPTGPWNLSIGQRYRQSGEFGPDDIGNNLILGSIAYRFSENWAVRATYQFEARDGRMEEQSYMIYRDLRSWTAALVLRYRDNRVSNDDLTVAVTFSLKAFPRFKSGEDTDRPMRLLGL